MTYENREININGFTGARSSKPIWFARVEVIRVSDGAVLATGSSDVNGVYSIDFSDSGTARVYVRVLSKTKTSSAQNINLEVRDNLTQGALYAVRSSSFDEDAVPASVDIYATVASGGGGPFNILDVLTDVSQWVIALQGGTAPPLLKAYWETGGSDGTCFNSGLDAIFLLGGGSNGDTDEYDDDIIIHEYGHFIAQKLSKDNSPGGPHSISNS